MSGTHGEARLQQALAIVLKESAGLRLPSLDPSVLFARLRAVCASLRDRPHLTPQELLAAAQGQRGDTKLRDVLLDIFADKETAFFRDRQTFDFVGEDLQQRRAQKTITIWCCACSTGQEALSLVMTWLKRQREAGTTEETGKEETGERSAAAPSVQPSRLVVYASDMSARAIETARKGRYNNFDVQHGLNVRDLLDFFDEQPGGGFWKAKETLLSHTTFFRHNLLHSPPSFLPRRLDGIFFPYTLQHFDPFVAERVLARLASMLAPDGWLALEPHEAERYGERLFPQDTRVPSLPLPRGVLARSAFAHPDRGAQANKGAGS